MKKIAIVGATGATGEQLISLALEAGYSDLHLIASTKSIGKSLNFGTHAFIIHPLESLYEQSFDAIFLAAGSKVSTLVRQNLPPSSTLVIDLSSAFRQDPTVPLIIPEINPEDFDPKSHFWVSSPNCVTTLYLMVLAPLFKSYRADKVILSTYQAASGAGTYAMEELKKETLAFLEERPYPPRAFKDPYAFNLFTHNAPFLNGLDNEEELKIREESRKILKDPLYKVSSTCVRVPTLRAHAISAYVSFQNPPTLAAIHQILTCAPGLSPSEDFENNRFATPQMASHSTAVHYGRIRPDACCNHSFWFWIVGDQLLKGASYNGWQIYQLKEKSLISCETI